MSCDVCVLALWLDLDRWTVGAERVGISWLSGLGGCDVLRKPR